MTHNFIISIDEKIDEKEKASGKNDLIIGSLFFLRGIITTISNLGYVFWGAIIFGGIQFFRGIAKV